MMCARRSAKWTVLIAMLVAWSATAQAPDLGAMDIVQRSLPPGPVAFVDGEPVSREDFLHLYTLRLTSLREQGGAEISDDTRVKAAIATLSELAQEAFLLAEAKRRNIQVSDARVSEVYAAEIKKLQELAVAQGLERPTEGEILQKAGESAEEVRADIRRTLLAKEAMQQLLANEKIEVTDAEVAAFYKERGETLIVPEGIHLKQILIKPGPVPAKATDADWDAARKRIDRALVRIRAGERFETVARDVSEAPDAERGGDLGMLPVQEGRSALPPFFLEAVRSLKPGDLSPIFRSEFGWHLLKLEGRTSGGSAPANTADPRVREYIRAAKSERALDSIIQPILQDPERVRIYLQLPRSIAAQLRSDDGSR